MQFNWSTFFIEIINFLILLWVLKRLFYTPITKVISQRKQEIQDSLDKAEQLKNDAQELEKKYQNRVKYWEDEKEEKRKVLEQELEELKYKKLEALKESLMKEKERIKSLERRRIQKQIETNLREALGLAAQFSTKFLKTFADKELEEKVVSVFIETLPRFPKEQFQKLELEFSDKKIPILVESAYPLHKEQRQTISNHFSNIFDKKKIGVTFDHNPNLLAGLCITIGSMVLQANLQNELKFFTEVLREPTQE